MADESVYPYLLCCAKLDVDTVGEDVIHACFDVKFWPWSEDDGSSDQYFAVAATTQLLICRTRHGQDPPFDILRCIDYRQQGYKLNSVVWTKDVHGKPLLCAAGVEPRHILVIDIETEETRALSGHGKNINDLAISPINTDILASVSEDFTIRLWNLHRDYDFQPCVAILAGEGHRQPVMACAFHNSGCWLMSGGMDTAVALWALPDVARTREDAERSSRPRDAEPATIFHPHFYSAEVHDNIVDCIAFYDNIIISRCSKEQGETHNDILIWKITGFDGSVSSTALPPPVSSPDAYTRSAFTTDPLALGFRRLLTLDMPNTDRFYLRFGLYHAADRKPLLCMTNQNNTMFFWDLHLLEERFLQISQLDEPDVLDTPFTPVVPHHHIKLNPHDGERFMANTTSWSPDGRWLVSVGDLNNMFIMYRDDVGSTIDQ